MPTTAPSPSSSPTPVRPAPAATRLLWVDLVRAASLLVVVVGHVLIAVIAVGSDRPTGPAPITATALLDVAPWTHPATWVLQVMACFFAVGAVARAPRTHAAAAAGEPWHARLGVDARQLLVPVVPLIAAWLLLGPAMAAVAGAPVATTAMAAALVPLWFLATYLVVQALLPAVVAVVGAHGPGRPIAALLVLVGTVDALHLAGVPVVGWVNFALVWLVPTVLGTAMGLHGVPRRTLLWTAVLAGTAAVALVVAAGYPVPVVGVTDAVRSNNAPPSLLLALHGLAYASLVLVLAPHAERWLQASAAQRRGLAIAGTWSMAVYLWHMTGLVILVAAAALLPLPVVDELLAMDLLTPAWWLARPVVIVLTLACTAGLVACVARPTARLASWSATRPAPGRLSSLAGTAAAVLGVALAVQGSLVATAVLLGASLVVLHPGWGTASRRPRVRGGRGSRSAPDGMAGR